MADDDDGRKSTRGGGGGASDRRSRTDVHTDYGRGPRPRLASLVASRERCSGRGLQCGPARERADGPERRECSVSRRSALHHTVRLLALRGDSHRLCVSRLGRGPARGPRARETTGTPGGRLPPSVSPCRSSSLRPSPSLDICTGMRAIVPFAASRVRPSTLVSKENLACTDLSEPFRDARESLETQRLARS